MAFNTLSTSLVTLLALSATVSAGHVEPAHLQPRGTLSSSAAESTITAKPKRSIVATTTGLITETTSPLPLTDYYYDYASVPYKVNPYAIGRGPQSGYNQCNSTTEGADALCQTAIINSVSDFCLWGSPGNTPNETIGDVEAAVVAYCTKAGHGARIMPAGTITAVQFMRTPGYIQVVGLLNQTGLNLNETDYGGELDPHGADLLGNPLGGLVYSNGFSETNGTYTQTQSWNNFVGGGTFCFKLCDPSYDSGKIDYCQNRYDLIGCNYNMPAAYTPDVFESCDGDLQDEVATYSISGTTYTWSQPSVLPATSTLPWTPRIPASSNCATYQSSDLFPASDLGYASSSSLVVSATTTTGSAAASGTKGASGSRSGSSSTVATKTGTSSDSSSTSASSGGRTIGMSFGALAAIGFAAFAAL